jgi:hypothetical protein
VLPGGNERCLAATRLTEEKPPTTESQKAQKSKCKSQNAKPGNGELRPLSPIPGFDFCILHLTFSLFSRQNPRHKIIAGHNEIGRR